MTVRRCAIAILSCTPVAAFAVPPHAGWVSPSLADEMKTKGVIYVSDDGGQVVDIFTKSIPSKMVGQITSGICAPIGLAVDAKGTLYVANFYAECAGGGPSITIYPAGATTPATTLVDAMYDPILVAIGPKNGTLYATDEGHNVLEFDQGQTKVSRIVYPYGGSPNGVAVNPSGDLYISYLDAAGWHIGARHKGSRGFVDQGIRLTYGGGITFDAAGNLIAVDQRAGVVEVFAPGATVPSKTYSGFSDPYTIALDPDGSTLYVADIGKRDIVELAYPSGKTLGSITGFYDNTFGVAASAPSGDATAAGGR